MGMNKFSQLKWEPLSRIAQYTMSSSLLKLMAVSGG